ncbi:MAG TPA: DUF882 domain-containing protein, partial [Arenibaculum sp.]|nr:DUF882 domain-containing protein [Arenibaculum sp.]
MAVRVLQMLVCTIPLLAPLLAGCAASSSPPAPPLPSRSPDSASARTILLQHPWHGDVVHVVYRRGNSYDADAFDRIAPMFRDRGTGETHPVPPELIDLLWDLRNTLGLGEEHPIHVVSGYRSPRARTVALGGKASSGAGNSYHGRAEAADIRIPGVPGKTVAKAARNLGRGGWAHYPRTDHVHVDVGPVR